MNVLKTIPVVAMLFVGCASASSSTKVDPNKSLYDRLGQKPAITAVVDDFVGNIAGDTRINAAFAKTDIPHLKEMLVEQICQASGGPCTYTGKDMRTAHEGMHITDDQFNALVEDLVKSLNKLKVDQKSQNDLVGALGAMKGDIVGH